MSSAAKMRPVAEEALVLYLVVPGPVDPNIMRVFDRCKGAVLSDVGRYRMTNAAIALEHAGVRPTAIFFAPRVAAAEAATDSFATVFGRRTPIAVEEMLDDLGEDALSYNLHSRAAGFLEDFRNAHSVGSFILIVREAMKTALEEAWSKEEGPSLSQTSLEDQIPEISVLLSRDLSTRR